MIETSGVIEKEQGNGFYLVTLEQPAGHQCLCRAAGKLTKFRIKLLAGDKVLVEISPYDLTRGRITYRERNAGLGDGAEAPQAWQRWLADGPIQALVASINPLRHRPAAQLLARPALLTEGDDTTHVSVADGRGGLVATTSSINFSYGNGVTVPGAGFLLNNHMDDFTAKPGSANGFGLVQGRANAIRPAKP
jgi:translation initiation factor IF-1